jgi:hypothetical protein
VTPEMNWSMLRNGFPLLFDESQHDVFNALSRSNSVNLWIWAACEPDKKDIRGLVTLFCICFVAPKR